MYDSVEVAWKILQLASQRGIRLSNLQLQKLVYLAHGYLLGWKNKPLICDDVEAWEYGPVISHVYHNFKDFGNNFIPVNRTIITSLDNDEDAIATIGGVLNLYGDKHPMELVNLTHQLGTPWDIAWNQQNGKAYYSHRIDNELIKNHFRKAISDPNSVRGL
ncbi:type II toxin-antitoxin system antitoxin SocA domain-containing protein (plasmid) [Shewanella khirikhana]|uniref:Panacea domain-containing protein n=1 Tax=Shewanella khirikhana TaxID=1965282 RepID=UPI0030D4643B